MPPLSNNDTNDLLDSVQQLSSINAQTLNLGIIGVSGAGKTALMHSQFHALMTRRHDDIWLEMPENIKNKILQDYEAFSSSGSMNPTGRRSEFLVHLMYGNDCLFRFNWMDFTGGTVEFANYANSTDRGAFNEVFNFVEKSSAIIVVAGAAEWRTNPQKVLQELTFLKKIIEKSLETHSRFIHVVCALTKADIVGLNRTAFTTAWDNTALLENCREVFRGVFSDLATRDDVLLDIVPTSTFGSSRFDKTGRVDQGFFRKKSTPLQSYQVDAPLRLIFHTLMGMLHQSAPQKEQELQDDFKKVHEKKIESRSNYRRSAMSLYSHTDPQGKADLQERKRDMNHFINEERVIKSSLTGLSRKQSAINALISSCKNIVKLDISHV